MEFCLFKTAIEDEIIIYRQVGGEPAAVRSFQTGLRILLPVPMRNQCGMAPPTVKDPQELVELRGVLAALLSERREAQPHEKRLAREAIATAASQFMNKEYMEAVFLWLTIQGYEDEKASIVANEGDFFP